MLGWLVARRHHQGGFAALVQAAEPTSVGKRLFRLLFVFPDLHRLAAAWTSIAISGNDDVFFSPAFLLQFAQPRSLEARTPAVTRAFERSSLTGVLELGRHIAVRWHIAVDLETDADFNQNGRRPGHTVLPLNPCEIIEPKNGTASSRAAAMRRGGSRRISPSCRSYCVRRVPSGSLFTLSEIIAVSCVVCWLSSVYCAMSR